MDDLTRFLRPAGGGIFTVSTGRAQQEALQRRLYDAPDADEVQRKWQAALAGIGAARAAGAGIVDVGDVFAVPQLLEDEMLSDEQRRRTRVALYGPAAAADTGLPV